MNVILYDDSPKELLKKSSLIKNWEERIDESIKVTTLKVDTIDIFPGPRVGFLECDVSYINNSIKGNEHFLLAGGSVSIVLLIQCESLDYDLTLLVRQPRLGSGTLTYEFPAGMVDDSYDYKGVALRELEEECGITLKEEELIDINQITKKDYYSYPSLIDESYHIFFGKIKMNEKQLNEIEGRNGGVDDEEQITQHFFKFEDVWKISTDSATISIFYIIQKLIKESKI